MRDFCTYFVLKHFLIIETMHLVLKEKSNTSVIQIVVWKVDEVCAVESLVLFASSNL